MSSNETANQKDAAMQTATFKSLCEDVKITNTFGAKLARDKQDEWQQRANGWRVTLTYKGRRMSVDYWMGSAIKGKPTSEAVLECLLSDACSGEESFEDFCANCGYDTDSRKAERIYRACQKNLKNVRRLLGDEFEAFARSDRN